jgi:hypothetical protein
MTLTFLHAAAGSCSGRTAQECPEDCKRIACAMLQRRCGEPIRACKATVVPADHVPQADWKVRKVWLLLTTL